MDTRDALTEYVKRVQFPVTKEELINGLLAADAPGEYIALIERLPREQYENSSQALADLDEISGEHTEEIARARGYDDFLRIVLERSGDIQHMTKEAYLGIVADVVQTARRTGALNAGEAGRTQQRLDAAFAALREPMSEITDDKAPIDPREDLPKSRA